MKSQSIILILSFLVSCSAVSNEKQVNTLDDKALTNKYYSLDSLLVVDIAFKSDSLIGIHCFTSVDGNRIDCCIEKQSLFLKRKSNDIYVGYMISCYDEKSYPITIEAVKEKMRFLIVNDDHEFMTYETVLFEAKRK